MSALPKPGRENPRMRASVAVELWQVVSGLPGLIEDCRPEEVCQRDADVLRRAAESIESMLGGRRAAKGRAAEAGACPCCAHQMGEHGDKGCLARVVDAAGDVDLCGCEARWSGPA